MHIRQSNLAHNLDLEMEQLQKFAETAKQDKVLTSQSDLDPKLHAAPEMLVWCRQQGNIVVLNDGTILTSNPSSRTVQNCKIVMSHQGLRPEGVLAAHSSLIKILLENAEEPSAISHSSEIETVSTQQQRLRILVKEALIEKASDIHIEVRTDIARIRFRKHGEMYLHAEWLPKLGREIASVAFNKETDHAITHFNPFIPQSASMPLIIDGHEIRLRISSMPAHGGFDVVMRLLDTVEEQILSLEELGYSPAQIHILKKAINMPHGAVIISGPTGSGKTTTLASCMNMVDASRKVYMIENPVEKVVDKVTQVPVNSDQYDRTFASMGVAALRMDPNLIVLGEMRDLDTATVMVRAALTGHLAFSTLHTNSAAGIVTRLVEMGISQLLLADPNMLVSLICQRLAPVLCESCARPIAESAEHELCLERWKKLLGDDIKNVRVRGKFCPRCKGLGVSGRTAVAEIIWVDEPGREFIRKCDISGWEKYLHANGWVSYRQQMAELVRQGLCDPLDAEKIVGDVNPAFMTPNFNYKEIN
jgi:type II secretory ATPase GspE/PulE/Tfp pilus assembly ATPase PilB-like protein